jgi:hypothetical protein
MDINKYGRTILICSFSAAGIIVLGKKAFKCVKDEIFFRGYSKKIDNEMRNSSEEYDEDEEEYEEEMPESEKKLPIISEEDKEEENTVYIDDLYVCKFANAIKAEKYANKYGEFVVTLYKIEGFTYVYITEEKVAKKAKFYLGSIVVNKEEREKSIGVAFKDTSMIFEFDTRERAEFFLEISGIKKFVIWEGYILVDASGTDKEKHMGLSRLAKECFGIEIIDSYTIERVREALSSVTEKGEGLI